MPSDSTSEPASAPTGTRRVEVDPERLPGWVERFRARHGELSCLASGEGLLLSAPDGATAHMFVPWPGAADSPVDSPEGNRADSPEALVAHVQRTRTVGLLLVRRGGFAVGVAQGATLVDSTVGKRHVQGKTKAGGWSQQRYARRRDAQARTAFVAAAEAAAKVLLPRRRDLDGLVCGGDRKAVADVLTDARLRPLADLPRGRFLAVPDPRRRVLEDAVRRSRAVAVDVYDPEYD